MDYQIKP